jgi:pyruvate kinase
VNRTKIVCTLGPATESDEILDALVDAGLDCARLNFSHGSHENHARAAARVRAAAQRARRPIAILADLCGPKMRIGTFANGSVTLVKGAPFTLTTREVEGSETEVHVTYEPLPNDVKIGDSILLDDGLLGLRVTGTNKTDVFTVVEDAGVLSNKKGLNLPGSTLSAPALTEKDKVDLAFAVDVLKVDYVALSFVRSADDVRLAHKLAGGIPIIAKIEKPEALECFAEILDVADGIMVARGDLGVEVGSEKVPLVQKRLIRETNERGKIVITATQMLDSMIRNPRPTRAEAADVANAVIDGTDAVMLSGETASGMYPVEAVKMMASIVREVEAGYVEVLSQKVSEVKFAGTEDWRFPNATARAAALLASHLPLAAVVCFTKDGRTATLISEHRPRAPILAITDDPRAATRMALLWGVIPRLEVPPESLEETLRIASAHLVRDKLCKTGDAFALVVPWPLSGPSNAIKLHRL